MEDGLKPPPAQYKHRIRARTEPFWCLLLSMKPFTEQKHCKYSLLLAISGGGEGERSREEEHTKINAGCGFLYSFWVTSHSDKLNRPGGLKTGLVLKLSRSGLHYRV